MDSEIRSGGEPKGGEQKGPGQEVRDYVNDKARAIASSEELSKAKEDLGFGDLVVENGMADMEIFGKQAKVYFINEEGGMSSVDIIFDDVSELTELEDLENKKARIARALKDAGYKVNNWQHVGFPDSRLKSVVYKVENEK
ncbi:MAG: hypothetical protein HOA57_03375 [Candidatus Magasanikbacteria bacterium]|jgi:hypothetical protein|nr:hypothetical protein [Candidatus Magasanikbacteria bacterium]MBT4314764.1 hypothetical protein [Candidatus Magasanikbacteria bacterium]MBT4547541.1 hypothetical protein [Candidatus Magasanikbacteria bacterium]MBT6819393.1 hypothetical protein [Candidatus Magasanikbacteria bacterium]